MLKLFGFVQRRADFSPAEFMDYWRSVHAPIGESVAGIEGYVLSEKLPTGEPDGPAAFDGVAEFWFADAAGRLAMRNLPQAPAWFADTLNFIGRQKSFLVEEHLSSYSTAQTHSYKSLLLFHGDSANHLANADSAIEQLRADHYPISGSAFWNVLEEMTRPDLPPVELQRPSCIAELWFADLERLRETVDAVCASGTQTARFVLREHVIKPGPRSNQKCAPKVTP